MARRQGGTGTPVEQEGAEALKRSSFSGSYVGAGSLLPHYGGLDSDIGVLLAGEEFTISLNEVLHDGADVAFRQEKLVIRIIEGADFNGDGFVDSSDLEIWESNFGADSVSLAQGGSVFELALAESSGLGSAL